MTVDVLGDVLGELLGAVGSVIELLRKAADPLTAIVVGAALIAAVTRPIRWVRSAVLRTALRQPLRRSRAWQIDNDGNPRASAILDPDLSSQRSSTSIDAFVPAEVSRRRRLVRVISTATGRALDGEDVLAADLVSRLIAEPGAHTPRPWPFFAQRLSRLMRVAGSTRAPGLIARLLYPDDTRSMAIFFDGAFRHLQRFSDAEPVDVGRIDSLYARQRIEGKTSKQGVPFPVFASALSGAPILVDAASTRSRYVDDVLVWHARQYRAPANDSAGESDSYDASHQGAQTCSAWQRSRLPAGDYDKRVLSLDAVGLAESATHGVLSFVLETSETCYAATEQGWLRTKPEHGQVGCKHLLPRPGRDDFDPVFQWEPWAGGKGYRLARARGVAGRVTLLTSYVSLITSDDCLVLAQRSRLVRHGQGVISATAGGVLEPDGEGATGDVDAFGMPDPLTCVLRETKEELGLGLERAAVRPVCVFLANVRNLGEVPHGGLGQLVASILYVCRVPETFEALKSQLAKADPSLGGFEVDDLVEVRLRDANSQGFVGTATKLATYAQSNAERLDQHGLLSCLYAAVIVEGRDATIEAFLAAFKDQPWWDLASGGIHPRVVRDPRALLGSGLWPLDEAVGQWAPAWDGLSEALAAAEDRERARRAPEQEGNPRPGIHLTLSNPI